MSTTDVTTVEEPPPDAKAPEAPHWLDRITTVSPRVISVVAVAYAVFHAYTALRGSLPNIQQRDLHLGFALVLGFLLPASAENKVPRPIRLLCLLCAAVSTAACVYTFASYARIVDSVFLTTRSGDVLAGCALVVLVLILAVRLVGWTVPIMALLAMLYTLFGHHIPGYFGHAGISFDFTLQTIYLSDVGLWGPITGASASMVAVFILFAAVLNRTGAGDTLFALARVVTSRLRGGEAKLCVVGSAAFGTVHGTAVGNTAAVGPMTIPLMIRAGYTPKFSAAVETVASTGGQIMPPIMATAAFLMADLVGVPYTSIIQAAILPALLYFAAVWFVIDLESRRIGMKKRTKAQLAAERAEQIAAGGRRAEFQSINVWTLAQAFIPIGLLLYALYIGRSIPLSGAYALFASIGIYILRSRSLAELYRRTKDMVLALKEGGISLIMLAVLVVAAQLIIAFLDASGLIQKLSGVLVEVADVNVTLALLMAALIVMVLGLGLPTTAAYLLAVPAVGGGLILGFGIDPLAAHLFLLYYAVLSNVTPPVAPPAYVAAGIARTPWGPVAWLAMLIAAPLYVLPQFFVLRGTLLLHGHPLAIALDVVAAAFGVFLFAVATVGFFRRKLSTPVRILVWGAGLLSLAPTSLWSWIGLGAGAAILAYAAAWDRGGAPDEPAVVPVAEPDLHTVEPTGAER